MIFKPITKVLTFGIVDQIAQDIYKQIVWEYIIYSIKVGLFAGLVIAVVGIILGFFKATTLDLTTYTGCMLSGTNKGPAPFIVGFSVHMIASAGFGVAYLYLIHTFKIPPTLAYALALGAAHTFFSGSLMLLLDVINPCTRNKMVPYVGFMGTAQGLSAMLAYVFTHMLFAVIVFNLLMR